LAPSTRLHDKSPLRRKTEQLIIRWLASGMAWIARILPLRWLQALGNAFGWLIYALVGRRREVALSNLERVFGDRFDERERRRIVLASTRNMTKTMLELLKLPAMSREQLERFAPVRGEEHLREAAEAGDGVIVVTPHFGNWELMAARIASLGYDLSVIAREANDPVTADLIRNSRESSGEQVLERHQVREMLRTLREGNVLGILPDQHAGHTGIWLTFMGLPACTAVGPASLASRTNARIVPGFARRKEDGTLDVYFLPAITVPEGDDRQQSIRQATQRINDVLGEQIRKYPEQWMWMHNRWREPPADLDTPATAGA